MKIILFALCLAAISATEKVTNRFEARNLALTNGTCIPTQTAVTFGSIPYDESINDVDVDLATAHIYMVGSSKDS